MGVRGLTTFIDNKQDVFMKKYYLHDTKLIIDGKNLCSELYKSLEKKLHKSYSAFKADYDNYALHVKSFFKNLGKCNVTAYVIFDGCYEKKKLKTLYSRLQTNLKKASEGSQNFPVLYRNVFKEVLLEMNIAFTICEFEADNEIASFARHLNCPVLSYDSDFFIYNVLYIPFNTLDIEPKPIYVNDQNPDAMECKIFKVQYLTEHFGGLNQELLPLLATLLGNDFVEQKVFSKSILQLKPTNSKNNHNNEQSNIYDVFNWLQKETLVSAISKILGTFKKNQTHRRVYFIIKNGIEGYHIKKCSSINYFDIPEEKTKQEIETNIPNIKELESLLDDNATMDNKLTDDNELSDNESVDDNSLNDEKSTEVENTVGSKQNILPDWFVAKMRNNSMPSEYFNLFAHHTKFCKPQPEDFSNDDSFLCCLPLLRYAFDLLTDFAHENCVYVSREKVNYKKILVGKEFSIPRCIEKSFNNLTNDELKCCFNHFIKHRMENLDWNLVSLLPSNFQLFMLAILWWVAHCNVPITHVHSVVMTYIFLNVIDERTGTVRGHFLFNSNNKKILEELRNREEPVMSEEELYLNKNKVEYEDCVIAASVLLKHFEIDDTIRKKPKSYNVDIMHSFAQFQCILQQINSLNALCNHPLDKTVYYKSYSGTFVYNIALILEYQTNPEKFFKQYIKGATTVLMFYRSICSVIDNLMSQMNLTAVKCSKRKRKRNKKGTGNNTGTDDGLFIAEAFASEVVI